MNLFKIIAILFLLQVAPCFSQSFLRVTYTRFGATRIYEVPVNDRLEFKLKGESRFRKDKIIEMRDSSILFETYTEVRLSQIKALRLRTHNHLVTTFQTLFLMGGIGFISLNTINNSITNTSPVFNEKAAYISAGLLAASFLIREIGIKRIRMTKNKDLKILNIDFKHMNADTTSAVK